jgi:hypothetical protein
MKTTGVTLVQMLNGEIHLGCITSKGVSSDAVRLPVPKSPVIPLANALLAMVQADQVSGQEAVLTPEQAEAAQTLLEIAMDSGGDLADLARAVANALDGDRIVIREAADELSDNEPSHSASQ